MQKIAIFDFDDTLIDGQSLDLFYRFVLSNQSSTTRNVFSRFCILLSRLFAYNPRLRQQVKFLAFWGIRESILDLLSSRFCTEVLEKRLLLPVKAELDSHLRLGLSIVVLSAGFQSYLAELFKNSTQIHIIASTYHVSDGLYRSISEFCYGQRKLELLQHYFLNETVDWNASYAYSDHISDLPLLLAVGNPVVVGKGTRPSWCKPEWNFISV